MGPLTDAVGEVISYEQTYTDPETGEQRDVLGGTLPFGPASGAVANLPRTVRAGGAVVGDYLFNYGPVGQEARERDAGPRDIADEASDAVDDLTVDASTWDIPSSNDIPDPTETASTIRLAAYALVAVASLWLLRPLLEIGANVSD